MKKSQAQTVLARIEEVGYVDNLWAKDNYILRLAAVIKDLKDAGKEFDGEYGKKLGYSKPNWKNFYYFPAGKTLKHVEEKKAIKAKYKDVCTHGVPTFVPCPNCKKV